MSLPATGPSVLAQGALAQDAVARLQQAFVASVDAQVDRAVGAEADAAVRSALHRHIVASARFGRKLTPEAVAEMGAKPAAEIDANTESMRDPMPWLSRVTMRFHGRLRSRDARYDALFGKEDRLYFPLASTGPSPTQREVELRLGEAGYRVTDYIAGHATDAVGKQSFRIGKLLNRLDPQLSEDFQHDAARTSERLLLCLTRDPLDIARMSTGRAWWSCMARDGFNFDYVKEDVRLGTLAAYLIRDSDPQIFAPLGRILLKPFGHDGARILVANKPYGIANSRFQKTAGQLAEALSAGAPAGLYNMPHKLYADGLSRGRFFLGAQPTLEALLDAVGARSIAMADGRLVVKGALHIDNMGLSRLPDMRHVVVQGSFDCSGNGLTTLEGMPQKVHGGVNVSGNALDDLTGMPAQLDGSLTCRRNGLRSLAGAPQVIVGDFDCAENELSSLEGGPASVGGHYVCDSNRLRSLKGAPATISGSLHLTENPQLASMAGGPARVHGDLRCDRSGLITLVGMPQQVGGLISLLDNRLRTLEGMPAKVGTVQAEGNPFVSLEGAPTQFQTLRTSFGNFGFSEPLPERYLAGAAQRPRRGNVQEV